MNKYSLRRWLIIWISILLYRIAGFRRGDLVGHNAGHQEAFQAAVDHV